MFEITAISIHRPSGNAHNRCFANFHHLAVAGYVAKLGCQIQQSKLIVMICLITLQYHRRLTVVLKKITRYVCQRTELARASAYFCPNVALLKRHGTSGYTVASRVMRVSWLSIFLLTQAPDPTALLAKTASACLTAHNKVCGFSHSFKRYHHEIFHTICIAYNSVRIECLR
jgi:hypothetical protein